MTVTIRHGDCRKVLQTMPDHSVHCCVTSPPYFGLRDYGHAGQIGMEATPDAFVAEMVAVFREVKRVLRDDGTLWLNLGDSYAGSGRGGNPDGGTKQGTNKGSQSVGVLYGLDQAGADAERARMKEQFAALKNGGLKQKDMIGIPWRVAFALQADGWYLRQDIIWSKPNPMPESVTDRCTKAHEYIFLMSKSAKYYYDADAIKEASLTNDPRRPYTSEGAWQMDGRPAEQRHGGEPRSFKGSKFNQGKTAEHQLGRASDKPRRAPPDVYTGAAFEHPHSEPRGPGSNFGEFEKRNKRSVWTVSTQSFSEAHFATFPPDLIDPCILAGCPKGGTVLDPFGGAGTTGLVADRLKRDSILIELNPEYADMAENRIRGDAGLFASVNRIAW